jgi:hypothetical protein
VPDVVHAADIAADRDSHPLGAGLRAIGEGGPPVEDNDLELLNRATFVYDASTPTASSTPARRAGAAKGRSPKAGATRRSAEPPTVRAR